MSIPNLDVQTGTRTIRLLSLAVLSLLIVDRPIAVGMAGLPQWFRTGAVWVSEATAPVVVLPALLCLSVFSMFSRAARPVHKPVFAYFSLCCSMAALVSSLLVKNAIGRVRPDAAGGFDRLSFKPFAFEDAFAAMPSTQAALAAAVVCSAAICFPRQRIWLLATGALVCLSRVASGSHWTSDVIAGWTLGWLVVAAIARFFVRSKG